MYRYLKARIRKKIKLNYLKFRNKKLILGENLRVDWKTNIEINNNKLVIGNNVFLRSNPKGYHGGMSFPTTILIDKRGAECFIGDNCRINGCYIHAQKKITVGKNTVIASGTNILDSNGHETLSSNRTIGRDSPAEIMIGDNVWIGLNSIVLKGTEIGDNSIVAASSVVKGCFPKNSLIQGNPAKLIKTLDIKK